MIRWIHTSILSCMLAGIPLAQAKKAEYDLDRKIAKFAIMHGNNYLAQDLSSKRGRLLLQFGSAIDPDNEIALLANGYLERGRRPNPMDVPVTEKEVVDVMIKRARLLSEGEFQKNVKVGPLCRLYATFAEKDRPEDPNVILVLTRLGARGVKDDLHTMLTRSLDLKDIFNEPQPPPQTELNVQLDKKDLTIADAAADLGTNRLAKNLQDALGLKLLQLAGQMIPDDDRVLLAMGMLFRGKKPAAVKTGFTEKRLQEMLIRRGSELAGTEDTPRQRLGLLYLRLAEEFGIEDRVVLGIARLEKAGIKGELHDLLTTAVKTVAVASTATDKLDRPTETAAAKLSNREIRKLDIDGDADKKNLKRTDNYEPTEITLTGTVANRNETAVADLSVTVFIIATKTRSRKSFMITKREDVDGLTLAPGKETQPFSVKATCYEYTDRLKKYAHVAYQPEHWESYYYCYVIVLRDKDGRIIKTELPRDSSLIRDVVPQIAAMKEDWHFNRDGQVTAKDPAVPRINGTKTIDDIRERWRPKSRGRGRWRR